MIVTHERIASAMVDTAVKFFGRSPLPLRVLPISSDCDLDDVLCQARGLLEDLDDGQGVLILTDFYGSTPSNVAKSLVDPLRVWMVSGINLPMLVRVMNYPALTLPQLAEKAATGGRDGVLVCKGEECE